MLHLLTPNCIWKVLANECNLRWKHIKTSSPAKEPVKNTGIWTRQMDRGNIVPKESEEQKRISLLKLFCLAWELLSHRSGKEMLSDTCRGTGKSTQTLRVTLRWLKWKCKKSPQPKPQQQQQNIMTKYYQTLNPYWRIISNGNTIS